MFGMRVDIKLGDQAGNSSLDDWVRHVLTCVYETEEGLIGFRVEGEAPPNSENQKTQQLRKDDLQV